MITFQDGFEKSHNKFGPSLIILRLGFQVLKKMVVIMTQKITMTRRRIENIIMIMMTMIMQTAPVIVTPMALMTTTARKAMTMGMCE